MQSEFSGGGALKCGADKAVKAGHMIAAPERRDRASLVSAERFPVVPEELFIPASILPPPRSFFSRGDGRTEGQSAALKSDTECRLAELETRAALRHSIWQSDLHGWWKVTLLLLCDQADAYGMVTIDYAASAISHSVTEKRMRYRVEKLTKRGFLRPIGATLSSGGTFHVVPRQ